MKPVDRLFEGLKHLFSQRAVLLVVLTLLLAVVFSGCILLKASEAPDSGFISHPELLIEDRGRFPFNKVWIFDKLEYQQIKKEYSSIVILPVRTDILEKEIKERDYSKRTEQQRMDEAREIAVFLQESLKIMIEDYESHPLKIVSKSGPKTFVLEIALVELEPTSPVVKFLGTAAGFFVPGGGLIKSLGNGSVAIEGVLRDSVSGQSFMQFKDREIDKSSLFTFKDFQEYEHVREAVSDWAMQYAELSATSLDHEVSDSLPFSLQPY